MCYKGSKILKKNLGRSHDRIFIKTFYTPVPPWLSISYVSNTTVWKRVSVIRHCQIVAVCRNLLKINHLRRLSKQVTLYNLYNYLKINQSCRTPSRISKRTPGPRRNPGTAWMTPSRPAAPPEPRLPWHQITRHGRRSPIYNIILLKRFTTESPENTPL